jgi:hypothetical protein
MDRIAEYDWPARWNNPGSEISVGETAQQWTTSEDYRSFSIDGSADDEIWMRYEHRIPNAEQWALVRKGKTVPPSFVRPVPITDFCAYNSGRTSMNNLLNLAVGNYWVGDLAMKCHVDVQDDSGSIILELVEGGRRFQCRINVADGKATLSIDGLDSFSHTVDTDLRAFGSHDIIFSNCDDQLRLWIDGNLVAEPTYTPFESVYFTNADLSPVGVGSQGAALKVSQLEILRDIYYISDPNARGNIVNTPVGQYETTGDNISEPEYVLEGDQFFMLGDNSPCSKDSRYWGAGKHFVNRDLMIGKAVFIYWPHSWERLPGTSIPFPFFPNFPDMGLVR